MQMARIKLSGRDFKQLDEVCQEIIGIAKKLGVDWKGPVPLPTKKLKVVTMKTPCGDGTGHGNTTYDRWEMRIHKRFIDMQADDRALRQVLRVQIPQNIHVSIKVQE